MTTTTTHRDLAAILADLGDFKIANTGAKAIELYHELEDALRAQLAPLPEGEAERLAAQAEADARTMAPPVPGVTRNSGYTVQAVMPGGPAEPGSLAYWWVACENECGSWVTWMACRMDGSQAGKLSYDGGNYFTSADHTENKRKALADLAVRAGTMNQVGLRLANEIRQDVERRRFGPLTSDQREDRRMASRLLKWLGQ